MAERPTEETKKYEYVDHQQDFQSNLPRGTSSTSIIIGLIVVAALIAALIVYASGGFDFGAPEAETPAPATDSGSQ